MEEKINIEWTGEEGDFKVEVDKDAWLFFYKEYDECWEKIPYPGNSLIKRAKKELKKQERVRERQRIIRQDEDKENQRTFIKKVTTGMGIVVSVILLIGIVVAVILGVLLISWAVIYVFLFLIPDIWEWWHSWISASIVFTICIFSLIFFENWGNEEWLEEIGFIKKAIGTGCGFLMVVTLICSVILGFKGLGETLDNLFDGKTGTYMNDDDYPPSPWGDKEWRGRESSHGW